MKNTIFAVAIIIALVSCQSNKKKEATKTEQTAISETVTTENAFFASNGRIVTPETYPTDETSRQLLKSQNLAGINKFNHKPQLTPTDQQPVVRMNRDTYYSMAVIDVSEG